jgi:multidrug resistance efflux pump
MENKMPNQRRIVFIAGLIVVLGLFAELGYRYWYQPTYDFVNTDDAQVTGSFVQIAAPASGQIDALYFDVGSSVKKDAALASIKVVAPVASAASGPSVPRILAQVNSPVGGTVAVRNVNVGDTVAAGQPIAKVVDLNQLWVIANVDEDRAMSIRVGQTVDIAISAEDQTFQGQVAEIGSATTEATTAPSVVGLPSSSDSTKKVSVKIVFDFAGARHVPGMSATVTIYTVGAPE